MSNVTFYCGIKNVEMKPGSPIASMRGFAITAQAEKGKDIEPGDLRNYRCPLVAGPMSGVKSAEIGLYASYRTLWLDRRSPIFSLTWSADSVPPRWIEGD